MNTKSGDCVQYTGREAAVKQCINWLMWVKLTLASSLIIGGKDSCCILHHLQWQYKMWAHFVQLIS